MIFIKDKIEKILSGLPAGVELEAAAKDRSVEEIQAAIEAGVKIIGENYLQEAEKAFKVIGSRVKWHFIGHLQKNKIRKAVEIFNLIETVDSLELAQEIDRKVKEISKIMPVLIEVNSGREAQKFGVFPEKVIELAKAISNLSNLKLSGLMTMGPLVENPEALRPYFRETKKLFEEIKAINLPNTDLRYLSMGMSDSYRVAIEEGANLVRIGRGIFS